ncbi:hypothetical protein [Cocleimonas flava]|uniref:Uncharacterized protein n=1 Tax=Cocleimonas flava TaxID=634765 RepID=A0A4R1F765_9GAMM|nr:hypothetical protein [Cocleimonas flava]TCJ88444.1 hypothetical protein EV695_0298 [Cocleimonas flava]
MNNLLILRRRGFQAFQGWQFWLQLFLILSTFVSLGVLYTFIKTDDFFTHSFVYIPVIWSIFFYFHQQFMNKSTLEIDEFGLSHQSGLPDMLKRFHPDWRISWTEIQVVEPVQSVIAKNTILLPLNVKLLNKTIKVLPSQWVDPTQQVKKPLFKFGHDIADMYEESALVKVFEAKGLLKVKRSADGKYQSGLTENSLGTDINSSPVSIAMAGFVFFALFYFITEVYFTLSEFYAGAPPYLYMIVAGVIAVILSYLLLSKTKFTLAEKVIFAVFMGLSTAAVMYPLLLRVNEWSDTEGLQRFSYTKADTVMWQPQRKNLPSDEQVPTLKFDLASSEYWAQFEVGAIKEFEIRNGGLGFYQLNKEPIYEEQKVFYEKKNP